MINSYDNLSYVYHIIIIPATPPRQVVPGAECASRVFRAERRGLCADSATLLLESQFCSMPRHSAPYGARIGASWARITARIGARISPKKCASLV